MALAPAAISDRTTCTICLSDILPEAKISKLNCGHEYHEECLAPWLIEKGTCPLDRQRITSINGKPRINAPRRNVQSSRILTLQPLLFSGPFLWLVWHESEENPLIREIHDPAILSVDPIERIEVAFQGIFLPTLRRWMDDVFLKLLI